MIRYLIPLLLTASAAAQTLSLTATPEDTRIQLHVADSLSPRPATVEVRTVPDGALLGSIVRVTPFPQNLPGLERNTLYDITVAVSGEAVAIQEWTTWGGIPGRAVHRTQPLIAAEIDSVMGHILASAEARSQAYTDAVVEDWTNAVRQARAERRARIQSRADDEANAVPGLP